jgi:hypothetical protein
MADSIRKWEQHQKAIILALHKTMLQSEFKDQYAANLAHSVSLLNQFAGEEILKDVLNPDFLDNGNDDE